MSKIYELDEIEKDILCDVIKDYLRVNDIKNKADCIYEGDKMVFDLLDKLGG